jgi:Ni,Fe-hydrogenase III component G
MIEFDHARSLLADLVNEWQSPEDTRLDALLDTCNLLRAVWRLNNARWGYLAAITGLDSGSDFEVLYHFCQGQAVLTLRLRCPYDAAAVPSICPTYPYASVFERELMEMFGITVEGTPETSRLFLPDDWPEGLAPLRKTVGESSDAHEPETH